MKSDKSGIIIVMESMILHQISGAVPCAWKNPFIGTAEKSCFSENDITDAEERLKRFAPLIARLYPETAAAGGLIESPVSELSAMRKELGLKGRLLLKRDDSLPISGSVKARGGIYEVLKYAETIVLDEGMLRLTDDYAVLAEPSFCRLFKEYSIAVGSTGNLGLSIGIMGAALGFRVRVYMSRDARQWKKDLLRAKGAEVIESDRDYLYAVAEGRRAAEADPLCHFVDDENSADLFLGYSVAGKRVRKQLDTMGIIVDDAHPLAVYLPCGVGGGPGGITFGLKQIFGKNVHCYFAEPVQAPAVILGLATGKNNEVSAADLGLSGKTEADGLAVTRPSGLVCREMKAILDGCYTLPDERLFEMLRLLWKTEHIRVEPSACAGFDGLLRMGEDAPETTHLVWATGGSMVPEWEYEKWLE